MVVGTGVDIIEIARFEPWCSYSREKLARIFSEHEIEYALASPQWISARLAKRFATREAFYKAYVQTLVTLNLGAPAPFLTVCSAIIVQHGRFKEPSLIVNWPRLLNCPKPSLVAHLSLSDNRSMAIASVIIEII